MANDVIIEAVSKLTLEPGDILVVKTRVPMRPEELGILQGALSRHFGFPVQVLGAESDTKLEVIEGRCPHGHKKNGVVTCPLCAR